MLNAFRGSKFNNETTSNNARVTEENIIYLKNDLPIFYKVTTDQFIENFAKTREHILFKPEERDIKMINFMKDRFYRFH